MAQCHLSWDSFVKNICNGFSHLQQHEEFVDMTLAADGYLVRVHKTLMALASPYIKEMLKSAPGQHPVLFLNSVSHKVMGYILQYVYTGEVHVPTESMSEFIAAAKALRIVGISSLYVPKVQSHNLPNSKLENEEVTLKESKELNMNLAQNSVIHNDINMTQESEDNWVDENLPFPETGSNTAGNDGEAATSAPVAEPSDVMEDFATLTNQSKYNLELNLPESEPNQIDVTTRSEPFIVKTVENVNASENSDSLNDNRQLKNYNVDVQISSNTKEGCIPTITINAGTIDEAAALAPAVSKEKETIIDIDTNAPLFTTTSRGSLQLILNRFLYNQHHTARRGARRRWRCIDYRHNSCRAYIDTDGDTIIERKFAHNHPFHDEKIIKRGRSKNVYNTISETEQALHNPLVFSDITDRDDTVADQS